MSTSRKPRKHPESTAIDRPFAPDILVRARQVAAGYQVVMWLEDGDYYGRGVELPGTMDDGRTPDECMSKTREAFVTTVAYMLEVGETPPPPAAGGARNESIPVPVSALELLTLKSAAEQHGFRDVGSYVRAAALGGPSAKPVRRSLRRQSIAR